MAEDKEKQENGGSSGAGRWWEFYVVRYALGTVFGSLIVHSLIGVGLALPLPNESLKALIEPNYWPLLLGYGLAFCYLSSAPILVFHATRFTLVTKGIRWSFMLTLLVSIAVPIGWASLVPADTMPTVSIGARVVACISIGFVTFILISQLIPLFGILNNSTKLWTFYKKLDLIRRNKENKELVNSYRHLREHGNAFFVVLLEIFFGLAIYSAVKVPLISKDFVSIALCGGKIPQSCAVDGIISLVQVLVLVLLWVLPATYIWTVGCLFEREFANDPIASTPVVSASSTSTANSGVQASATPASSSAANSSNTTTSSNPP